MGWSITIGEFDVEIDFKNRTAHCFAESHREQGAPINSSLDQTNNIMPGYCAWDDFCRRHGLRILSEGCHALSESDYAEFLAAYERHDYDPEPFDKLGLVEYVDTAPATNDHWDALRIFAGLSGGRVGLSTIANTQQ